MTHTVVPRALLVDYPLRSLLRRKAPQTRVWFALGSWSRPGEQHDVWEVLYASNSAWLEPLTAMTMHCRVCSGGVA